ncbi:MAG: hypothetical protein HUJ56_01755 [Erysipelotrichaceae bacterium]|nr:hypothetical protein [Erysipelotrichaceae bacterium]
MFGSVDFGYGKSTIEHAQKRGITPEAQRLKDRELHGETTALNPEDTGWTTADYERLAGIGMDVVSMFMDPVTGMAVGLGGTAAHTLADFTDKSVSTGQALKNLGMNLGLDTLAIIPGLESMKIIKNLHPFVPKLMKWVSVGMAGAGGVSTIKNGDEILKSLQKIADGDPKTKLTVGDWQNIGQAIMGVTGVYNVGKSHVAFNKTKQAITDPRQIGVGLVDANGNSHDIILKGKRADEMVKAVESGKTEDA